MHVIPKPEFPRPEKQRESWLNLNGQWDFKLFPAGSEAETGSLLTDSRQEDAVRRAKNAIARAKEALESGFTPDAILTDAEEALEALGELTGRTAKEEIVGRIFSRFCVGK